MTPVSPRLEGVRPDDPDDARLLGHLRPAAHRNPTPRDRYDLVVIGGGPGGLVAAHGAAGLGARVALVERALLGGDCLVVGCVPSKALLAGAAGQVSTAHDGKTALRHARSVRADIAPHDGVARLQDAGIDVFLGEGRFVGPDVVAVGDAALRFAHAIVATGARAARPPIPGLDHPEVLDAAGVWTLEGLPQRVAVLGAGPIGAELSQAMARLGTAVDLVDLAPRVLPRDDPDAASVVEAALVRDGVRLHLGTGIDGVDRVEEGFEVRLAGQPTPLAVDRVVVALGRTPNVEGLGLEAAGIPVGREGVVVDDRLRTANPRVYAIGDVIGGGFTHVADAHARLAVQNALVAPTARWTTPHPPAATYTDPELAHVGPSVAHLRATRGVVPITIPWSDLDRGRVEGAPRGEQAGFLRAWIDPRGRLIAATVVGPHAGELLAPGVLAIAQGLKADALSSLVLPYPTRAEAWKRVGDAARRRKLTPTVASVLRRWIRWRGAGA